MSLSPRDPKKRVNFRVKKGADWHWSLFDFDFEEGLANVEFFMQVRETSESSSSLIIDFSTNNYFTVDAQNNSLTGRVPGETTAAITQSKGFHDLFVRRQDGREEWIMYGEVDFIGSVTVIPEEP